MAQWLQDLLIGIVSGSVAGFVSGVAAAAAIAFCAAGIASGVWNPKKQIERVQDLVPKEEFSKRWKDWLTYTEELETRPRTTSHLINTLAFTLLRTQGVRIEAPLYPKRLPGRVGNILPVH